MAGSNPLVSVSPVTVVRACLQAYVDKDQGAIEKLIADEYRFTSPLDNALDRANYFERCWPNSPAIAAFTVIHEATDGECAFVTYEARTSTGKRFRNTEVHVVRDGRLIATEVYFGWDVPHKAPLGGFLEQPKPT
jgi:hypothetical protein